MTLEAWIVEYQVVVQRQEACSQNPNTREAHCSRYRALQRPVVLLSGLA
jgi:hypothetical protein